MKLRLFLALVVVGVLAVVLLSALDGDSQPSPSKAVGPPEEVTLRKDQERKVQVAALDDPTVRAIAGGSRAIASFTYPWTAEETNELIGAVVEISLRPPVDFKGQRVPVVFTPGPTAPPGAPDLYRTLVLSAVEVNRLEASVELDGSRVVEVMPIGNSRITAGRLLGPPLAPVYTERGD
jgi:hypothetical protein